MKKCKHETIKLEKGIVESFDSGEVIVSCEEVCEDCDEVIARPSLIYRRDY